MAGLADSIEWVLECGLGTVQVTVVVVQEVSLLAYFAHVHARTQLAVQHAGFADSLVLSVAIGTLLNAFMLKFDVAYLASLARLPAAARLTA